MNKTLSKIAIALMVLGTPLIASNDNNAPQQVTSDWQMLSNTQALVDASTKLIKATIPSEGTPIANSELMDEQLNSLLKHIELLGLTNVPSFQKSLQNIYSLKQYIEMYKTGPRKTTLTAARYALKRAQLGDQRYKSIINSEEYQNRSSNWNKFIVHILSKFSDWSGLKEVRQKLKEISQNINSENFTSYKDEFKRLYELLNADINKNYSGSKNTVKDIQTIIEGLSEEMRQIRRVASSWINFFKRTPGDVNDFLQIMKTCEQINRLLFGNEQIVLPKYDFYPSWSDEEYKPANSTGFSFGNQIIKFVTKNGEIFSKFIKDENGAIIPIIKGKPQPQTIAQEDPVLLKESFPTQAPIASQNSPKSELLSSLQQQTRTRVPVQLETNLSTPSRDSSNSSRSSSRGQDMMPAQTKARVPSRSRNSSIRNVKTPSSSRAQQKFPTPSQDSLNSSLSSSQDMMPAPTSTRTHSSKSKSLTRNVKTPSSSRTQQKLPTSSQKQTSTKGPVQKQIKSTTSSKPRPKTKASVQKQINPLPQSQAPQGND